MAPGTRNTNYSTLSSTKCQDVDGVARNRRSFGNPLQGAPAPTARSIIATPSRQGSATARPPLPPVLRPRVGDRLPLHVPHRVRPAAVQRDDVVLPVAEASAGRPPGRGAGVLALEFARHRAGAVLARRGDRRQREAADQRTEDELPKRPSERSRLVIAYRPCFGGRCSGRCHHHSSAQERKEPRRGLC
jgi:hypothetical protein